MYRARDVRLERTVAVKILPPELAADTKYRQRFHREARAASALSHPNVAHIYDVGEQDGTHFIAMELVEGENLRALVSKGPLSADRVADLGVQLSQLPNLKVISRRSAFMFKDDQGDLGEIGSKLGVQALLLGRMVQRGEELSISAELVSVAEDRQLWGGRYRRQLADILAIERELTDTIVGRLRLELTGQEAERLARGGTRDAEAYQLYLKGRARAPRCTTSDSPSSRPDATTRPS